MAGTDTPSCERAQRDERGRRAPLNRPADSANPRQAGHRNIEIPHVVTMNFALDACSQEPDGFQ